MHSVSWPQSWELHTALLVPVFQELIRNRVPLRNSTQKEKITCGFLEVERPLTIPPFFIIFVKKVLTNWVCLVWTILLKRHQYITNIITKTIINVTVPDPILWVMLWNHPRGFSPDNWPASCSAEVSKLLEEGRLLGKTLKIFFLIIVHLRKHYHVCLASEIWFVSNHKHSSWT